MKEKNTKNVKKDPTIDLSFYLFPKPLVVDKRFSTLSNNAIVLFALIMSRMRLSAKNDWTDENGRVYIIFTVEDAAEHLKLSDRKTVQVFAELEKCGLIQRRRRGQGKPNFIYMSAFNEFIYDLNPGENQINGETQKRTDNGIKKTKNSQKCKFETSRNDHIAFAEVHDLPGNNNEMIRNNFNNRIVSYPTIVGNTSKTKNKGTSDTMRCDTMTRAVSQEEYDLAVLEVQQLIDYRLLIEYDYVLQDELDEIVDVIAEVFCSKKKTIRISGQEHTVGKICKRLRSLTSEHILYVCESMSNTTTEIKNIRKYLLAALYNAPVSISSYYGAKVRSDFAKKNNDAP